MQPTLPDYHHLLTAVKQRVREAQYRALQQVNQQQIQLYWDLGTRNGFLAQAVREISNHWLEISAG